MGKSGFLVNPTVRQSVRSEIDLTATSSRAFGGRRLAAPLVRNPHAEITGTLLDQRRNTLSDRDLRELNKEGTCFSIQYKRDAC